MSRRLLPLTITAVVSLEYLQSVMMAFASSYVMGGVAASPEEFSLTAAAYASVALVMIGKHRWLVERLGYRRFILGSLLVFSLGAVLCALAERSSSFMLGRMVQALGAATFFTGARLLINQLEPAQRLLGVRCFAGGLMTSTALSPIIASYFLAQGEWRLIFWLMLPLSALTALLTWFSVPGATVPKEERSQSSPALLLALSGSLVLLQYAIERFRYSFFSEGGAIMALTLAALAGLGYFVYREWQRPRPLLALRSIGSRRYWIGLILYFGCYTLLAANNYILPNFLHNVLGYAIESTGTLMALSIVGLGLLFLQTSTFGRRFSSRSFLVLGFVCFSAYGFLLSQATPEVSLAWIAPAVVLSGMAVTMTLGTAAQAVFLDVEESSFSHAYQAKNMVREIASAGGVSLAAIILQMRSEVHYDQLSERFNPFNSDLASQLGSLSQGLGQEGAGDAQSTALAMLASSLQQQSTFLACLDYFWLVALLGAVAAALMAWQRVFR